MIKALFLPYMQSLPRPFGDNRVKVDTGHACEKQSNSLTHGYEPLDDARSNKYAT